MISINTPPGFRGLQDDLPVTVYERNLPHWRQQGATYFVTFRLNDSIPGHKQSELREIREHWLDENPLTHDKAQQEELSRLLTQKQETWLDAGFGDCALASPRGLALMRDALLFFDEARYELGATVIMPNHVHCVLRPYSGWPLEKTIQSWKRHVSLKLGQPDPKEFGTLWFEENFDRIIRDGEHLWECVQYIGRNPTKAKLSSNQFELWLR